MNIHIIMPFCRKHYTEKLTHYLEPMGIIWHPICDEIDIEPFKSNEKHWIQPLLVPPLIIPGDQCYRKCNDFIDAGDIVDDDYYGFAHDDDMYNPEFIEKLKSQTAGVIFYSASRGDSWATDDIGPYNWPPIPLLINSLDDVRIANIDMCQYFVKGRILRQTRFNNLSVCDDGIYAEGLKNRWPEECLVMPEFGIYFNYFQPGRYTGKDGIPKPEM